MKSNDLVIQWRGLVFNIVNRYRAKTFKNKTYIDWDDIEQAGMLALCKASQSYNESKGLFRNYAISTITRAVVRQLKFYNELENWQEIEDFRETGGKDNTEIENKISCDIMRDRLLKIINNLSGVTPKSKEILLLRLQGYSLSEIADRIGTTYQSISKVILNHKDKLRELILRGDNDNRI